MPKTRAAGVFLITQSRPRQFLLMRHPTRWDVPKGHCESGETDVQTALRETQEETGLAVEAIKLDPEFRFELCYPVTYKGHGDKVFEKTLVLLLGEVESTFTPTLTEHAGYHWFDWQPPHRIQPQTIDPLLEAVARHLESRD